MSGRPVPTVDRRPRPLRARQAGGGGAAGARPRAGRQARLERGPVPAVPGGDRGDRALGGRPQPLPRRRLLGAPHRARRAARRRLRRGRRRLRRGRRHRPALAGDARPGRRDRLRLAVVPELRPRRGEARCHSGAGAVARPHVRPRRAARGDRSAHEARLRLPPEQPDRDGERPRRARVVPRPRFPSTCSSCSTRRISSTSTIPTTPTASPSSSARAGASWCCARSRRSTASPAFASDTPSLPWTSSSATSKVRRAFDVTRHRAGCGAREHRRRRGARAQARAERARARAADRSTARARTRARGARARQFRVRRGRATGARFFERLLRQGVIVRPLAASAHPRRSASRWAPRTRTRFSLPRSDRSFRAYRHSRGALLPSAGFARPPLQAAGAAGRRRLPAALLLDARVELRDAARGGRARDRRQGPDELRPLGRRRAPRRVPAGDRVGLDARAAARPARASEADGRRRSRPCRSLRRAAVRDLARGRSSRSRPSPGSRRASSGRRSTPACRISFRTSCSGRRTRCCRRSRTSAGRSGPIARRRAHRRRGTARRVLDQRSVVPHLCRVRRRAFRRGMLQSATALTRGHWTDLKEGFATVFRTRYLLAVLVGVGPRARRRRARSSVSEVFMAKNTLARRRLRLRPDLRSDRRRARDRQLLQQHDHRASRCRANVRARDRC